MIIGREISLAGTTRVNNLFSLAEDEDLCKKLSKWGCDDVANPGKAVKADPFFANVNFSPDISSACCLGSGLL